MQSRPPIGHLLFTFPLLLKYKTDFPVIINLPQRFRATISAKVRRHVFSAVSHNIRIAGARGHDIFPYGNLKNKIQSPLGACLKKLISDPALCSK